MAEGKNFGISAAVLKWIAVVTMIIDHFAASVYGQLENNIYEVYRLQRYIGRIAFPIYCFLLVEGFFYTRSRGRYILRCLIFAVLSEIPFDMAIFGSIFYLKGQNVYFTLTLGLCALWCIDRVRQARLWHLLSYIVQGVIIAVFLLAGQCLEVDYHWKGVFFIIMFYYCRGLQDWVRNIAGVAAFAYEVTAPLAFIPIQLYNGKRGKQNKYLFYAVYPVHLLIFGIIRFYITGKF